MISQLNNIVPSMWELSADLANDEKEAHLKFMSIDNILPCPAFNVYEICKNKNKDQYRMASSMCEFLQLVSEIEAGAFKYQKELDAMLIYASFACNTVKGLALLDPNFGDDDFPFKALLNRKTAFVLIVSMMARLRCDAQATVNIPSLHPATMLAHYEVRWETKHKTAVYHIPGQDRRINNFAFHVDIEWLSVFKFMGPQMRKADFEKLVKVFKTMTKEKRAICYDCVLLPTRAPATDGETPVEAPLIDADEHAFQINKTTMSDDSFGPGCVKPIIVEERK